MPVICILHVHTNVYVSTVLNTVFCIDETLQARLKFAHKQTDTQNNRWSNLIQYLPIIQSWSAKKASFNFFFPDFEEIHV